MKRHPFKMTSSRSAVLICDGKFVIGGRASFVWETYLMRRAAGVPGNCKIRASDKATWHEISHTVSEAEDELQTWGTFGAKRVKQMRKMRESRIERGLPVA